MTRIVLARFDSMASARSAAHALVAEGISEQAVSLLLEEGSQPVRRHRGPDLNSPSAWYGAIASAAALATLGAMLGAFALLLLHEDGAGLMLVGAAAGAYLGAVIGTVWVLRGVRRARRRAAEAEEEAVSRGVVLAVQIHPDEEAAVLGLLNDAGGRHIQRQQHMGRAPARWTPRDRGMGRTRRTQWQS